MVGQIYPTELKLYKAYFFDNKDPFLDFDLPITNGIVSSFMITRMILILK